MLIKFRQIKTFISSILLLTISNSQIQIYLFYIPASQVYAINSNLGKSKNTYPQQQVQKSSGSQPDPIPEPRPLSYSETGNFETTTPDPDDVVVPEVCFESCSTVGYCHRDRTCPDKYLQQDWTQSKNYINKYRLNERYSNNRYNCFPESSCDRPENYEQPAYFLSIDEEYFVTNQLEVTYIGQNEEDNVSRYVLTEEKRLRSLNSVTKQTTPAKSNTKNRKKGYNNKRRRRSSRSSSSSTSFSLSGSDNSSNNNLSSYTTSLSSIQNTKLQTQNLTINQSKNFFNNFLTSADKRQAAQSPKIQNRVTRSSDITKADITNPSNKMQSDNFRPNMISRYLYLKYAHIAYWGVDFEDLGLMVHRAMLIKRQPEVN